MKTIAELSVYPMIGQIIHPAPHFIATALLGYEENSLEDLAALSSATSAIVIVVTSIQFGFNNALVTLTSQAYGAGDSRLCGLYLNR